MTLTTNTTHARTHSNMLAIVRCVFGWLPAAGVLRSVSTAPVLLKPTAPPRSGRDVVLVDGVRTPFLVSGTG